MRPNLRKGTESVVTFGAISRITITSSGFWGTSSEDIVVVGSLRWGFDCWWYDVVEYVTVVVKLSLSNDVVQSMTQ